MPRSLDAIFMLLKHPLLLHGINKEGKEIAEKFGESKPFKIPEYEEGMPRCNSNEKYLRATYLCESNSPEIIAMANELGAFRLSSREYAENVFNFVRNNIRLRFIPARGAIETLKTGYGSCFDLANLFIAICRAGGLPSRYKIYIGERPREDFCYVFDIDERLVNGLVVITTVSTFTEVKIDGKWIESDISSSPEIEAASRIPIAHFGGNIRTTILNPKIIYREKIPRFMIFTSNLFFKIFGGIMDGFMRRSWEEFIKRGKRKLDEMGMEEYNKKAKRYYGFLPSL